MPERGFDSEFWSHPDVHRLPYDLKFLYIYLWTNPHCNQAGLYRIRPDVIALDMAPAGGADQVAQWLRALEVAGKIRWYEQKDLIWVKSFIRHQAKSSKWLIGAANCLAKTGDKSLVEEVLSYNRDYGISIPYRNHTQMIAVGFGKDTPSASKGRDTDNISILARASDTAPDTGTGTVKEKEGVGEEEKFRQVVGIYENNIGMATPLAAETLARLCRDYPVEWFSKAVSRAVTKEARNLNYIEGVLKGFKAEGLGNRHRVESAPTKGKDTFKPEMKVVGKDIDAEGRPLK